MLITLPLLGYILLFWLARRRGAGRREAALQAGLCWGVIAILLTEALSLIGRLDRTGLALAWVLVDIVLYVLVRRLSVGPIRESSSFADLRLAEALTLAGIALILFFSLLIALVAPPNHSDTMTYHLPRIVYWLQQGGVGFYPTDDGRQLHQPPGAEYGMLQLHVLAGSDRFDGMIQWSAFPLSILVVSLIAWKLGAQGRGQILAAVICATIPQGIMQTTGGKNDYVLAFLLAALVYYLLAFGEKPNAEHMLGLGAALGLSLMTKGTAYFYIPPLAAALALTWPRRVWARVWRLAPAGLAVIFALNLAHWTRNYRLVGNPAGPSVEGGIKFSNDLLTPGAIWSNLVRNAALHLWTPSERITHALEWRIVKLAQVGGLDVSDSRITWGGEHFRLPREPFSESRAPNTWHALLILPVILTMLWVRVRDRRFWLYILGIGGAFILFCVVLRWQPWHSRLHLPLFVLAAAPMGLLIARHWPRPVQILLAVVFLLLALPWAVHHGRRSLVPGSSANVFSRSRTELLFSRDPSLLPEYRAGAAAALSRGCAEIGIDSFLGSYEYPLLVLLGASNGATRVRHVGVRHPSRIYGPPETEFASCAVVCLQCDEGRAQRYLARGAQALDFGGLTVFVSKSGISP